jgi:hypothetical protein
MRKEKSGMRNESGKALLGHARIALALQAGEFSVSLSRRPFSLFAFRISRFSFFLSLFAFLFSHFSA